MAESPLKGKTVTIGVGRGVTKKHIDETLDSIYRIHGCLACGLLGIDLHFNGGGDPELAGQIHAGEGVTVTVQ